MTFQSVPEAIPVGVAAVLSGALAVFAWRRRARPTAPAFAAMMAGETVWALGATLEPLVVELPLKRLCIDLRLLGTFAAILALLAFLFRYTGRSRWLEPRRFGAICAPALALLVLAWTDPWHHLFWARLANEEVGGAWIAIRTFGPGFWATLAYCYALAAVATALLARAVMRFTGVYRAQAAVMLFGVLLPWAVDVLDMNRVWGFVPIDFVAMSFAVTGLTFLPGLLRFRLLGLTPVAWAAVVERMHDAVVVIDHEGRVAVLNPAARRLLGRPDREVLGVEAALAFGDWAALAGRLERIGDQPGASIEIDRRVLPGEDPQAALDHCLAYLNTHVLAGTPVVQERPFMLTRGLADEHNGPLAARLGEAIRKHGGPGRPIGVPYGTDAPHYAATGCPTVVFGPGSIDQAHTCDEWIEIAQLEAAVEILYDFAASGW